MKYKKGDRVQLKKGLYAITPGIQEWLNVWGGQIITIAATVDNYAYAVEELEGILFRDANFVGLESEVRFNNLSEEQFTAFLQGE